MGFYPYVYVGYQQSYSDSIPFFNTLIVLISCLHIMRMVLNFSIENNLDVCILQFIDVFIFMRS